MLQIVRSLWTSPLENEIGAPEKRIIHAKTVRFIGKGRNIKVTFCEGKGYYKCGSDKNLDAVCDADIYIEKSGRLEFYKSIRGIYPTTEESYTYEIEEDTTTLCIVVRKSRIDDWWPCYNIARSGIKIEADEDYYPQGERRILKVEKTNSFDIPDGVSFEENSIAAIWKTPYYKIGFRKKSAGLYSFCCDSDGEGNVRDELANKAPMNFDDNTEYTTQGAVLYPVGSGKCCNQYSVCLDGSTTVKGNGLCYNLTHQGAGLSWKMDFTLSPDKIKLKIEGEAEKESHWAIFSLLRLVFNSEATPVTLLAEPEKNGETGKITFIKGKKAVLHFPRFGSAMCTGEGIALRMTSVRDKTADVLDIVLPDIDREDGSVVVPKGKFSGEIELDFNVAIPKNVKADAPEEIRKAIEKFELTALPFRMDTATFSNNGNSQGAPICMDFWAEVCHVIGDGGFPKVSPMLRNTLEHWMLGAPAYATGRFSDRSHLFEDEYIMTGTATLSGIGTYLCDFADAEWYNKFKGIITEKLLQAEARVKDGDGIPVSPYRRGVSGEGKWSTNWYDVISYGHKDAFSTAVLYNGLQLLEKGFTRFDDFENAKICREWHETIKENFWNTFRTENGWVAGWLCANGELHDYAFLAVNGMAASYGLIPETQAKEVIRKLWNALLDAGFDNFDIGLPGNVYNIPQKDLAWPQIIYPFGGYENAGVTLSQSCHFLRGMLAVGMEEEAKFVLTQMARGLCSGINIGGVGSGIDWQTWDGVPSGYEGFLCDQMGVIAVMLEVWGK